MLLTPTTRLGPYEILDLLGEGAIGEVYRARDTRLGRLVAIKVLSSRLCADLDRVRRFEREARAASALNHPNVVAIYDIGSEGGVSFVVSELVEGETLRARLAAGPLPLGTAGSFALQIASGLAAAHDRGVVHRDLKPENVMITRDGRVKILDFGVAKVAPAPAALEAATLLPTGDHPTLPGTLVGTVAYMSPEQLRGEPVDRRSDAFSLGIVCYEMLAGRRPFDGATTAELMAAVLRDEPRPLPGVPAAVEAVVRRCLEKARDDRFPSLDDFTRALEPALRVPASGPTDGAPAAGRDAAAQPRTIAVLPFADVGPGPGSEYFSDGLTEELIHLLTRVRGLRVVAWNSASKLKGRADDVKGIARELGVGAALTGSVRRVGDRVRITVRLVEAASGYSLWSEAYDRRLEDLLALQEEIARAIVGALAETLTPPRQHPGPRRTGNVESFNLYLKGRYHWNRRTREGLAAAAECFEQAIAVDGTSALAHAGLADALCMATDYGFVRPGDVMPRASRAALAALDLDPWSAEAHASYGLIRAVYDWQWEEAEAFFRRALELNPGYATAHHWFGIDFLASLGRFDEAAAEIDRARDLDPLSLIIHEARGYLLMLERRYGEALQAYRAVLELDPSFYKVHTSMGRALVQMGKYDEGIALLEKGRALVGQVPSILGALGQAHALAGRPDTARRLLEALSGMASAAYVPSNALALVHAGLGENERALDWLERGCDARELPMTALAVHPAYDSLRGEPRFAALLARMRLG